VISQPYGVVMHDGKLYVCDVGQRTIHVLDIVNKTFSRMTADWRLMNPVNIIVEADGISTGPASCRWPQPMRLVWPGA